MFIDVVRKDVEAYMPTTFELHTPACSFHVKHFTQVSLLVCVDHCADSESVMIGAGMCEVANRNPDIDRSMTRTPTKQVIVKAKAAGTVEVIRYD